MTTGTINGISYVLPVGGNGYYKGIQNYVAKMFSNDPRVYEDSSILVLNATETPGLAATEQTTLEEAGYSNIYTDDTPAGEYSDSTPLLTPPPAPSSFSKKTTTSPPNPQKSSPPASPPTTTSS